MHAGSPRRRSRLQLALPFVLAGCDVMPTTTCGLPGELRSADINGDGRPDLRSVHLWGYELCREYDLDFDGRSDVLRVLDLRGSPLWIARDLDFDGHVDQLEIFANDVLVSELRDRDGDGHIDAQGPHTADWITR